MSFLAILVLFVSIFSLSSCGKEDVTPEASGRGTINISIKYYDYKDGNPDSLKSFADRRGFIYLFEHRGGTIDEKRTDHLNGTFYYEGDDKVHYAKRLSPVNADGIFTEKDAPYGRYIAVVRSGVRNLYSVKEFEVKTESHNEEKIFGFGGGVLEILQEDWVIDQP